MNTYRITTLYLMGQAEEVSVRELIVKYSSLRALTEFTASAYSQASSVTVEQIAA